VFRFSTGHRCQHVIWCIAAARGGAWSAVQVRRILDAPPQAFGHSCLEKALRARPARGAAAGLLLGGFRHIFAYTGRMTASRHRVLMNFQFREKWTVHFLEADCQTPLWRGRYYDFESVDRVREILVRAAPPPETFEEFDRCVRSWSRGSVYLDLTAEQYGRLKRGV
jgi:hypothetical protein